MNELLFQFTQNFLNHYAVDKTNLDYCFTHRTDDFSHKLSLNKEQQNRFIYFLNKITTADGFGSDIIEYATFLELMTSLNDIYIY